MPVLQNQIKEDLNSYESKDNLEGTLNLNKCNPLPVANDEIHVDESNKSNFNGYEEKVTSVSEQIEETKELELKNLYSDDNCNLPLPCFPFVRHRKNITYLQFPQLPYLPILLSPRFPNKEVLQKTG